MTGVRIPFVPFTFLKLCVLSLCLFRYISPFVPRSMKSTLLSIALLMAGLSLKGQVVINEICPANADLNYDPQYYNFSGWVELYNAGNSSVSIGGFYLSDDASQKTKWRIPSNTSIPAKGHKLI